MNTPTPSPLQAEIAELRKQADSNLVFLPTAARKAVRQLVDVAARMAADITYLEGELATMRERLATHRHGLLPNGEAGFPG